VAEDEPHHEDMVVLVKHERADGRAQSSVGHSFGVSPRPSLNIR
jgi:hypothetical protein